MSWTASNTDASGAIDQTTFPLFSKSRWTIVMAKPPYYNARFLNDRTYAVGGQAFGSPSTPLGSRGTSHFICVSVFALIERKNRNTDKMRSTMLPQAQRCLRAVLRKS